MCSGTIGMPTMVLAISELGSLRVNLTVRSSIFSTEASWAETEMKSSAGNFLI
ncbi:hypothetical protein D3C87_2146180 [compost metagenome]